MVWLSSTPAEQPDCPRAPDQPPGRDREAARELPRLRPRSHWMHSGMAPMFHMVSLDQSISLLTIGGKVVVVDGFDVARILDSVETGAAMVACADARHDRRPVVGLRCAAIRPNWIKLIGAMADLVPQAQIAEITQLLQASYANTFGSTETGIPPMSGGRIPIGEVPTELSKSQTRCASSDSSMRKTGTPDGTPGELAFPAPTLFSGYRNAPEVNAKDFRGGWFHMGDMFVRRPDAGPRFRRPCQILDQVGRREHLPGRDRARPARRPSRRRRCRGPQSRRGWGEVPVAFVARRDESLTADDLCRLCRRHLAGYKRPKTSASSPSMPCRGAPRQDTAPRGRALAGAGARMTREIGDRRDWRNAASASFRPDFACHGGGCRDGRPADAGICSEGGRQVGHRRGHHADTGALRLSRRSAWRFELFCSFRFPGRRRIACAPMLASMQSRRASQSRRWLLPGRLGNSRRRSFAFHLPPCKTGVRESLTASMRNSDLFCPLGAAPCTYGLTEYGRALCPCRTSNTPCSTAAASFATFPAFDNTSPHA